MARRALVIVEGGTNTLPYVQAAQRLGLDPIILSADPNRYNYLAAEVDEIIQADTNNVDALISECSRLGEAYNIAGITSATETFYAIAGKLCQHFGLPGPNPVATERCCDKFTQRQLLAEAGVPIPVYRLAGNAKEVESSAADIGLPVILKPAVGIGSMGVRLCRNVDELAEHTAHLLGGKHIWRCLPRILVEEFAQGPYYWADLMGNEVIGIGTGEFGPSPHFVYREWIYPALLSDDEHERITDISLSCLQALGLGWGPKSIELRWTKRGPVVIEVNPRLSGRPGPQMVKLASGTDLITEHLKLAIGDNLGLHRKQTAGTRFLVPDRDGILNCIGGHSQASAVPGVIEVRLNVEPETRIVRKGDFRDCIGYVMAASPNRAQTDQILNRAVGLINWSIT
ncbi:acetyl-CoA carboxylase biotin carboxylase subunit family protein [Mesorhizobium sp. M0761]|uniref:ATP-grasp domain-containing protein n=1 Tax=Mesorhizobium sp. M0761 TaxID=2956994 RepID=UPI0033380010